MSHRLSQRFLCKGSEGQSAMMTGAEKRQERIALWSRLFLSRRKRSGLLQSLTCRNGA